MAVDRDRPIASLPVQDAHQLETSYRSWQTRRPQLFRQTSTNVPMASNTRICIYVIADGQEQPVKLSNTLYDSVSSKSLISKAKAVAAHGKIRPNPAVTVTDHTGSTYTSTSTIALRWYYTGESQTFPETFYVVEPTSKDFCHDAILRNSVEPPSVPQINAFCSAPPKASDSQRDRDREQKRQRDQEKYEKDREKQAREYRAAFKSKHERPTPCA